MIPKVPAVSVVIPTFNRSRQLVVALESALGQTWEDREVIVVDDGSTDDTIERLVPYWDRIRYHRQKNRGAAAAQNQGWKLARGRWVSILASDDRWESEKLAKQMEALRVVGADTGACFTNCRLNGSPRHPATAFDQAGFQPKELYSRVDNVVDLVLGRHPAIYVQSMIVLRSLLEELGGFDESFVVGEDTDLLFRLAHKTGFCCVNQPLVHIDRSLTGTDRLSNILTKRSDRSLAAQSARLEKWLRSVDCVASETRLRIVEDLKEVHYCWAISRLYRIRLLSALKNLLEIRKLGARSVEILGCLSFRARRRMRSTLQS